MARSCNARPGSSISISRAMECPSVVTITASASREGPSSSSTSQGEAAAVAAQSPHEGTGPDGSGRQCGGQGHGQRLHAIGQRYEHAVPRTRRLAFMLSHRPILRPLPPGGTDQAAVLLLHRQVLGKCGLETQVVRVARVDSTNERLHQPLECFASQPAPHESRKAFLGVIISPGNDQIHQHT